MSKQTNSGSVRISNSFSPGEIKVLDFVLNALLRGGDPKAVVRNADFTSVARKIADMKGRVEKLRGRRLDPILPPAEEGSAIVRRADLRPGRTASMMDDVD